MKQGSGFFPVKGMTLSKITQDPGLTTGISVLDDFLPWQGLPTGSITIIEGIGAVKLARKLVAHNLESRKTAWIHSLNHRPFFVENSSCFRLQIPEEAQASEVLSDILRGDSFTTVILQVQHPLSRAKALEIFELVRHSDVALILVARQNKSFPWELAELVIETGDDFLAVRKAQNRPVPFWIPLEMLESTAGSHHQPVVPMWDALISITG